MNKKLRNAIIGLTIAAVPRLVCLLPLWGFVSHLPALTTILLGPIGFGFSVTSIFKARGSTRYLGILGTIMNLTHMINGIFLVKAFIALGSI